MMAGGGELPIAGPMPPPERFDVVTVTLNPAIDQTIDVPGYRIADYIGGQATVGLEKLGVAAGGMMVVGALVAALWGVVGWWLGRRFEGPLRERTAPAAAQESKA